MKLKLIGKKPYVWEAYRVNKNYRLIISRVEPQKKRGKWKILVARIGAKKATKKLSGYKTLSAARNDLTKALKYVPSRCSKYNQRS